MDLTVSLQVGDQGAEGLSTDTGQEALFSGIESHAALDMTKSVTASSHFEHQLFGGDHDFTALEELGSVDAIKDFLDQKASARLFFTVNSQSYYLQKNASFAMHGQDVYQLFDRSGRLVDGDVVMEGDATVKGFMEIGGIGGVADGTGVRLYLGTNDQDEFAAIVYSSELDADDALVDGKSHRMTLLGEGEYVYLGSAEPEADPLSLQQTDLALDQAQTLPKLTFASNGQAAKFQEMSATNIKQLLDGSNFPRLNFSFEGKDYFFRKNISFAIHGEDVYQVFDRSGGLIDGRIEFLEDMAGDFLAVKGLPGLSDDERLYVGESEQGDFAVAVDRAGASEFSDELVLLENQDPNDQLLPGRRLAGTILRQRLLNIGDSLRSVSLTTTKSIETLSAAPSVTKPIVVPVDSPDIEAPDSNIFDFFSDESSSITGLATAQASVSFVSESAAYNSAIYTYDVDESGALSNFRLLIENTNRQATEKVGDVGVTNGKPNLLLLANGTSQISPDAELSYSDGNLLINGVSYVGMGYFSHDNSLDIGRKEGSTGANQFMFDSKTGQIRIEDMCTDLAGCDKDYNDLVLQINVNITASDFARLYTTIRPIGDMANKMAKQVNEADAEFITSIVNMNSGSFREQIYAQAEASSLMSVVSLSTGVLGALTSAASTSAGKIGQ